MVFSTVLYSARMLMEATAVRSFFSATGMLLTAYLAACMCGCGGPKGSLDNVAVVQYRYNIDEENDIVRVLGLVRNTGEERTPPGEIVVTLRGRTGSLKGQNRCDLPPLEAGAKHEFALAVTSHGKVDAVEIDVVPPGMASEDANAESGAGSGEEDE